MLELKFDPDWNHSFFKIYHFETFAEQRSYFNACHYSYFLQTRTPRITYSCSMEEKSVCLFPIILCFKTSILQVSGFWSRKLPDWIPNCIKVALKFLSRCIDRFKVEGIFYYILIERNGSTNNLLVK